MKKDYKGFGGFIKNILIMFTASYTLISLIWQINMHTKLKNADFVNVFTQNVNTNSAQKILNLFVNNTMPTILYYSIVISITFGALVYIIKDAKEINDKYAKVKLPEEKTELPEEEIVAKKEETKTTKKSTTKPAVKKATAAKTSTAKKTTAKASATKKATTKASTSKTGAAKKATTKASATKTGAAKKTTTKKTANSKK